MIKSLLGKAIIPVAITVTGFVVVCCLLLYSVLKKDMTADAVGQATMLSDIVVKSTRYAMLRSDDETLRNMIENISTREGVEHVRIFNKKGLIEFSSDRGEVKRFVDKKAAGCIGCHAGAVPAARLGDMERARRYVNEKGAAVIAITAPIYNEPDCFNAACHIHSPRQKVLGTLDIGLSGKPLETSLATMRRRMAVFSILVLILTAVGVSAMLTRAVTAPIRTMTEYCRAVALGERGVRLPSFQGEIGELAEVVRRIASEMEGCRVAGHGQGVKDGERVRAPEGPEGSGRTADTRSGDSGSGQ